MKNKKENACMEREKKKAPTRKGAHDHECTWVMTEFLATFKRNRIIIITGLLFLIYKKLQPLLTLYCIDVIIVQPYPAPHSH